MPRISRDEMFMQIAKVVAMRGTCDRARVGAVLVRNNNIVAIGYNGAPPGEPHCDEVGHLMEEGHCVRSIHAEINCLSKTFDTLEGEWVLYVTHAPCVNCSKAIIDFNKKLPKGSSLTLVYGLRYGGDFYDRAKMLITSEIQVRGDKNGPTSM